jgi:hypothetical protein
MTTYNKISETEVEKIIPQPDKKETITIEFLKNEITKCDAEIGYAEKDILTHQNHKTQMENRKSELLLEIVELEKLGVKEKVAEKPTEQPTEITE